MEEKETKHTKILSKIEPIDFIYLGVLFVFFIIIIILFFNSTNFILKNVNKIFLPNEEINSQALDMDKYSLIEKKLNLPINNPNPVVNTVSAPATETLVNTPVVTTPIVETPVAPIVPEVVVPTLDNKSLTISVLNGARKAGVASGMSTTLVSAGFSKATLGDSKTIYPITTILIKETKKDYTLSIEEVVKVSYPKAITKVNPETSSFDVVIIVGKE